MKNLKKITCALTAAALSLSLAACGSSGSGSGSVSSAPSSTGSGDKTIVVGTSNFTEVNILGELYTELIEANTDYTVDQRFGLAGAPSALTPWNREASICSWSTPGPP